MTFSFLLSASIHIGSKVLLLLLTVLLARTLGVEGFGVYAYAMAIASIFAVLAQAGTPQRLLRDVAVAHDEGDNAKAAFQVRRSVVFVLTSSCFLLFLGAVALVWKWNWGGLSASELYSFAGMLILFPMTAMVILWSNVVRGVKRTMFSQIAELVVRPLIAVIVVAAIFFLLEGRRLPEYGIAAQIFASLLTLFGILIVLRKLPLMKAMLRPQTEAYEWRKWLVGLAPFASISIATTLQTQTDVIMLGLWNSTEEVAIYRVATRSSHLVAFSLQILSMMFAAQIAALHARGDKEGLQRLLTRSARLAFFCALPLAIAFALEGELFLRFVFGDQFSAGSLPLSILVGGQLVNVAFGSIVTLLVMAGYEREFAKLLWLFVVANIGLNLVLIPLFGMTGAAIATVSSALFINLLLYRVLRQTIRLDPTVIGSKLT